MITLKRTIDSAIRNEGAQAYPTECCGFLLGELQNGDDRLITELLPITNNFAADEQFHRFLITPEDFLRAEKEARTRRLEILGFYHSHPDHPSFPSQYDQDHALPFYSYIIVSVQKGAATTLNSFQLTPERTKFIEEEVNLCQ